VGTLKRKMQLDRQCPCSLLLQNDAHFVDHTKDASC